MLTEIYVEIDDFCKANSKMIEQTWKTTGLLKKPHPSQLSLSEVTTILVYYHLSVYRNFQSYYEEHVLKDLRRDFPDAVSYGRFVQLIPRCLVVVMMFLQYRCSQSKATGIYYGDSYPLPSCHPKRVHQHRVMKGFANWGKTSVGWFYGMKCHIVINELGQLMNCYVTSGNIADNNVKVLFLLTRNLWGCFFGDKGYMLNEEKRDFLEKQGGLKFFTKARKNMKKQDLELAPKLWLKKRGVVESVINLHKNSCDVSHTRHRSPVNAIVNLFAGLIGYSYLQRKPSTSIHIEKYLIDLPKNKEMALAA